MQAKEIKQWFESSTVLHIINTVIWHPAVDVLPYYKWSNAEKNIEQINKSLQEKMQQAGLDTALSEIISWHSPMRKVETLLKEWHYNRLLLPEQQLENLPQTPEEAIKRGFIKASNFENMYHRHKNQTDNVKYYNKKTGQEIIFDANGKVVTDIETSVLIIITHQVMPLIIFCILGLMFYFIIFGAMMKTILLHS